MVDREARDQTAVLLRHLAIGRITDKQFDAALEPLPFSGKDRIFDAIFEETFSIKSASRYEVARWVLFLQSEAEYVWPGMDDTSNPLHIIAVVLAAFVLVNVFHNPAIGWGLTLAGGTVVWVIANRYFPNGYKPRDKEAWPFLRQTDLAEAARHPRLLNGKSKRTMR